MNYRKNKLTLISSGLLILLILVLSNGCKKYPEGPAFSLRTKHNRVVGKWEIVSYTVDGIEMIDSIGYPGRKFDFKGKKYDSSDWWIFPIDCDTCSSMRWGFSQEKEYLSFYGGERVDNNYFVHRYKDDSTQYTGRWEVLKLKNKEIHLKSIKNWTLFEYEIVLKSFN